MVLNKNLFVKSFGTLLLTMTIISIYLFTVVDAANKGVADCNIIAAEYICSVIIDIFITSSIIAYLKMFIYRKLAEKDPKNKL